MTDDAHVSGQSQRQMPGGDDVVLPFRTLSSGIVGRIVRLGPTVDGILRRHDYPAPVAEALGAVLALSALLGTALKFDGRFILQTKSDGPLGLLVANFESPGNLRGYASFDGDRVRALCDGDGKMDQGALFGHGHLAMTIDPGGDMDRYQGIVALEGLTLEETALNYFRQSEQLPSFLRLAVGRHYTADAGAGAWTWRAGGLLVQHLAQGGGKASAPKEDEAGNVLEVAGENDDDWQRTRILASTVEDHELLDPDLAPDRLLYRLFHEEGVSASEPRAIADECRCTRDRVAGFVSRFSTEEISDLQDDDGSITVTCEFCNTAYAFSQSDLNGLSGKGAG